MKRAWITLLAVLAFTPQGRAVIFVEDIPQLVQHTYSQAVNHVQYVQQTLQLVRQVMNTYQMIENQYTQIIGMYDGLRRLGDPHNYVKLLRLDDFRASGSGIAGGVGQSLYQIESAANGLSALGYTANGLYSNLTNTVDRFGNAVRYAPDAFRKFDAVNRASAAYDRQLGVYNQQIERMERQREDAVDAANRDSTTEGRARQEMLANHVQGQMDLLSAQTVISGQRVQQIQVQNQNDAARTQEAARQQLEQERRTSLENLANGASEWISGGTN